MEKSVFQKRRELREWAKSRGLSVEKKELLQKYNQSYYQSSQKMLTLKGIDGTDISFSQESN